MKFLYIFNILKSILYKFFYAKNIPLLETLSSILIPDDGMSALNNYRVVHDIKLKMSIFITIPLKMVSLSHGKTFCPLKFYLLFLRPIKFKIVYIIHLTIFY